jgi:lipoyl(octanoyl) transferase
MTYPPANWRLLITPPASGAWNMAVDEAILEQIGLGQSPPTLRLYAWAPPCLSLGYAQPANDVDRARLARLGWDIVRRPTGGRAILHTDELTYAVIGPLDEPRLQGSLLESYHRLADALLVSLQTLSLPAHADPEAAPGLAGGPVCFEVPSNYEITVDGKKLIGSAQARRKEGVLQHGSLPLAGDLGRILQALVFVDEQSRIQAAVRLHQRATTVEEVLGSPPTWEQASRAFITGFSQTLNLDLGKQDLSPAEQDRARELVELKYAHPSWTNRI